MGPSLKAEKSGDLNDLFAITMAARIQLPADVHARVIGIIVEHINKVGASFEEAAKGVPLE
jgi:hypothetical protein